jgi:hemerythrin superfamily protein
MKVTVLLRNDHDALRSLFDRFQKAPGARNQNGKKEVFQEIRRELLIHSQMEQEIFYPALASTTSSRAVELASDAAKEHQAIDEMLQELSSMNGSEKNFDAKMSELQEAVMEHIEQEEGEIFDEARKNLPEYRLEELGLEMEDRRRILQTLAA